MKQSLVFSLFLSLVVLLSSCASNPTKVLPSKDGEWAVSGNTKVTITTTGFPDNITNTPASGTASFTGSTVTFKSGSDSDTYNWSYDKDTEKITLTDNSGSYVYDVTSSSAKKQTWKMNSTSTASVGGITQTTTVVADITLTR